MFDRTTYLVNTGIIMVLTVSMAANHQPVWLVGDLNQISATICTMTWAWFSGYLIGEGTMGRDKTLLTQGVLLLILGFLFFLV